MTSLVECVKSKRPKPRCNFVDTYRQHMKSENAGVFLLAREHLTAEDLELAAVDFHPIADPLFGGATEERFARLLTSIEIAAGLS